MQDINVGLVVFMTLKNRDVLSADVHAQTDGYSLIKIRQHRQISLRDRRLKGNGKGILSAKETQGGRAKTPHTRHRPNLSATVGVVAVDRA